MPSHVSSASPGPALDFNRVSGKYDKRFQPQNKIKIVKIIGLLRAVWHLKYFWCNRVDRTVALKLPYHLIGKVPSSDPLSKMGSKLLKPS